MNTRDAGSPISAVVEEIYRTQSRRVYATLVRLLGDFDLAEEALQESFAIAVQKWAQEGVPANPVGWLISTARFKAIDAIRKRTRLQQNIVELDEALEQATSDLPDMDEAQFNDDQLRLIFTCCHPALSPSAQVALTLREICGLRTEEIASAFLTSPSTVAQRIVRAKSKIRNAKIPYEVPAKSDLHDRLASVLAVIYLVFNEGYSASSGGRVTRAELSNQAIHLGRMLLRLLPDAEVMGLLALMLLHESRRAARTDAAGDLILLEDQDRLRWKQELIAEGKVLLDQAFATGQVGSYALQAAISAVHASAVSAELTDWGKIVSYYDLLMQAESSPIVELNRAVAIAMRDGPTAGLELIDAVLSSGQLDEYHLAHAARADLCRRLGRNAEAREGYRRALTLAQQEPEQRFLNKRLDELR
jgi:RNA polymerase sigma-70 factor, ECF subfamily